MAPKVTCRTGWLADWTSSSRSLRTSSAERMSVLAYCPKIFSIPWRLATRPAGSDLVLDLAQEVLLAGVADQVGIGVPVADVVQGVVAAQLLIARLDVDLVVGVAGRETDVRVVVAPVDLHIHAPEVVDEVLEAREVDVDHVVDRNAEDLFDGLDGELRPADRVRRVDLLGGRRAVIGVNRHLQVARDREHRRVRLVRVKMNEQHRVRVRRRAAVDRALGPLVRADQQQRLRPARVGAGELVAEVELRALLERVGERLDLQQRARRDRRGDRRDHDQAAGQHADQQTPPRPDADTRTCAL